MTNASKHDEWPPAIGKEFIRSEAFGEIVLNWCEQLSERYPRMDFTDAASHVFAWFDSKLSKNRRFINKQRFATLRAFIAYVRQCVWNAARLAERQRQRLNQIEALSGEEPISGQQLSAEQLASLRELMEQALDKLPVVHKQIFEQFFFDEYDAEFLADSWNKSVAEIQEIIEEVIDLLDKYL